MTDHDEQHDAGPEDVPETIDLGDDASASSTTWDRLIDQLRSRGPIHARYVDEGEVARGGMGAIHRVYDQDVRRRLALKVMLGETEEPAEDGSLGRFLEEAQVTGQLEHPGIVPVHEVGVDAGGRVYFTMRLVKGEDLRSIFDRVADPSDDEWTTTRALNVMLRVCEAMAYAHAKGVIHRDLKPGNVMVGKYGEAYVMDWGLAKVLGRPDAHDLRLDPDVTASLKSDRREAASTPDSPILTMDGAVVGTPAYMPPEQAEGRVEDLGPPADVYAVGAMLYHLLSARMPYVKPGARMSPRTILLAVTQGPPPPLADVASDVPAELVAIVERAMAREVGDRYPDMTALAQDLRAFLEDRVVAAYETGPWAELKKWVQRNRALAGTAAAAVVVIAALTAWFVTNVRAKEREARRNERIAVTNEAEAERQRDRADEERRAAEAERDRVLRLSDKRRLDVLLADADALWPAHPENTSALEEWIARAGELLKKLPLHEATLEEVRARGTPLDHPRDAELAALREHLAKHAMGEVAAGESFGDAAARTGHVDGLVAAAVALDGAITRERDHDFGEDADTRWWHDAVRDLVVGLEELSSDDEYGRTVASVTKRLEFALTIEQRSLLDEEEAWDAAISLIANPDECPAYGGLVLTPQLGLVPIGRDVQSGLWEFWHVQSGERPERDGQGKLVLTEEMGIVLVLIPGGTFLMGAQSSDEDGPNYDPKAKSTVSDENGEPVEVTLDAYFLSKYEMTQGQWLRSTGTNPSTYDPHNYRTNWNAAGRPGNLLHPVENVSWIESERELFRLSLVLPTEARWEFACRAGTDTPWWTGSDLLDLDGAGNVADQFGKDAGGGNWSVWDEDLDDGHLVHAAVGGFRANAFGLHDTIGNLWEWCLDGYCIYGTEARAGDGARACPGARNRIRRGGSFNDSAHYARSAIRFGDTPDFRDYLLGCRPARSLEP